MRRNLSMFAAFVLLFAAPAAAAQQPQNFDNVEVQVLPVQGNVYMVAGGSGGNITLQIGSEGVLIVDTQYTAMAPKVLAAIRKLTDKPILWIVNTHVHADHTGGNEALPKLANTAAGQRPRVVAHENVLNRMTAPQPAGTPDALWPNDEYFMPQKDLSFNGEAVVIYHMPEAHTDGDSIVFFRKSDVISTGGIFVPGRYPMIDLQNGGGLRGIINALNRILQLTVPLKYQEGGTYIIPGHGRICDEAEIVEYRDMLTIIRDRVQDLIKKGLSLDQVKAARPTRDYDTEYGTNTGSWTTEMFVEAVYKSLSAGKSRSDR